MPWLNLSYQMLIHEDESDRNPKIKTPDISRDIQNVTVNHDKSDRITVYPNDTVSIATTARALLWDSTTELVFEKPVASEDNVRLRWTGTGTNPGFRTNRSIGGAADTQITISRLTPYVARIQNVGGTAWSLGAIEVNDALRFERDTDIFTSPLNENNRGNSYLIQQAGADYIDFVDNGNAIEEGPITLGADFEKVIRAIGPGPVKLSDQIEIDGVDVHPSNQGKYSIVDASTDYIEFTNPLGVDETFLLGSSDLVVYEHLIGFLHLRASGGILLKFGNQSEWVQVDRLGTEALFMASVCTHSIQARNESAEPVVISLQHAMVV